MTVLDDRATIGGRARSDELDGVLIDTGAQLISSSFVRTLQLLAPAPPELAPRITRGRDIFVRDGRRYPVQFGSLRSLLAFGGIGAMEKLRLTRHLLPLLTVHRSALDASMRSTPSDIDRQTARGFVAEHVDDRAADALVEPPLNSFYAARGDETSLAFYLTLARYGAESDVLAPPAGWSAALAGALRGAVHEAGVRVAALELRAASVIAVAEDGRRWEADGAVVATGPRTARTLLAPVLEESDALGAWLSGIQLRPTITLALAVGAALGRDAFGILQDRSSARMVSACAVHGAKIAAAAGSDRDVLLAWPTPEAASRLASEPSDYVVAAMMPEVETLVPECRGRVTRARVYRFDEGTPLVPPGFVADRARGRMLADSLRAPIRLAGDYLTAPLVEGAVESGEWAANALLRALGATR